MTHIPMKTSCTRTSHRFLIALALLACIQTHPASAVGTKSNQRPNLLLILADDMGFSDLGCFGSEVSTPQLDALATNGMRYTGFYNAARCCPTRAALLTGLYPHQAGVGGMVTAGDTAKPGPYQGYLNQKCRTLAEVLKPAGYNCYLSGKWHVGETKPHWPINRGFDHAYGLISGAMNYFDITKSKSKRIKRVFARDDQAVTPKPGTFYATDAFTDAALDNLKENEKTTMPFFLYLAYTAPHWPLHAPEDLIRKYEARYLANWQTFRESRHQRQIELGIIDKDTRLSPEDAADWDHMEASKKKTMARKMAVYAAMIERMDWNIGRVIDHLRDTKQLDNTLILFISDNGACAEGGLYGHNFRPDLEGPIGSVNSFHSYGQSWANVSNTPLRRFKSHTHEGGILSPAIVHWPAGLKRPKGSIDHQTVAHVIDIMPTFAELAGAQLPQNKDSALTPLPGLSLVPTLTADPPAKLTHRTLGWEHFGAAAWRVDSMKLVRAKQQAPWELYDLSKDPTELNNLAASQPDTLRQLAKDWQRWADGIGVK